MQKEILKINKNIKKIQNKLTNYEVGSNNYNNYSKRLKKKNTKLINYLKMRTNDITYKKIMDNDMSILNKEMLNGFNQKNKLS